MYCILNYILVTFEISLTKVRGDISQKLVRRSFSAVQGIAVRLVSQISLIFIFGGDEILVFVEMQCNNARINFLFCTRVKHVSINHITWTVPPTVDVDIGMLILHEQAVTRAYRCQHLNENIHGIKSNTCWLIVSAIDYRYVLFINSVRLHVLFRMELTLAGAYAQQKWQWMHEENRRNSPAVVRAGQSWLKMKLFTWIMWKK